MPGIELRLFDGLSNVYTASGTELENGLSIYAVEDSFLKINDDGLWVGDLKTLTTPPSTDDDDDDEDESSDETPDQPSSDELSDDPDYSEYGIESLYGSTPLTCPYLIKFINNGNSKFYTIQGQTVTEATSPLKKKSDYNCKYTIVEEVTIDSKKYGHGKAGWWCLLPPNGEAGSDDTTVVPLKGYDNWTINKFNSATTIKTNQEVVQNIYTMATHRIIARSKTGVSEHTTVRKSKKDVLMELNWLYRCGMQNPPTYHLRKNELLMFCTYTNHQPPAFDITKSPFVDQMTEHYGESCETLERSPSDNITVNAIFIIDDIAYTDGVVGTFPITDIQLRCVWTDGSIGKFNSLLY